MLQLQTLLSVSAAEQMEAADFFRYLHRMLNRCHWFVF